MEMCTNTCLNSFLAGDENGMLEEEWETKRVAISIAA
jgi:hypothetical protein